jgi:hypothetical protein
MSDISDNLYNWHKIQVSGFMTAYAVEQTGPYSYTYKNPEGRILKDRSLDEVVEQFFVMLRSRLATDTAFIKSKFPEKYWRSLLTHHLRIKWDDSMQAYHDEIKFDPKAEETGTAALRAVMRAMTSTDDEHMLSYYVAGVQQWMAMHKCKVRGQDISYHIMPIFCGPQGTGKSDTVKRHILSPFKHWLVRGNATLHNLGDDRYFETFEVFHFIFFDELAGAGKVEAAALKQAVTADYFDGRPMRTTDSRRYRNNAILIGATNQPIENLIRDDTGMRRFFPIPVPKQMDFATINKTDWKLIWRSVDERRIGLFLKPFNALLAQEQEGIRKLSQVELFIQEENIKFTHVVDADENAKPKSFSGKDLYDKFMMFIKGTGERYPLQTQEFYRALERAVPTLKRMDKSSKSNRSTRFFGSYVNEGNGMAEKDSATTITTIEKKGLA